jgi:hypothetical protein
MSEKGPFYAAIGVLQEHSGWHRGEKGIVQYEFEIEAAIRVLEAAGKVDKTRAIRVLATLLQVYVEEEGRLIPELEQALKDGAVIEIRALLEALPEKEERGET